MNEKLKTEHDILKEQRMEEETKYEVSECSLEEIIEYLDSGADINKLDSDGVTILFNSIECHRYDIAKLLINKGADVNIATQPCNWTPLYMATNDKQPELIRLLLEKGADCNIDITSGDLAVNAFLLAVANNDLELTKLFISHGGQINRRPNDGWASIHYAAYHLYPKVLRLLLSSGADVALKSTQEEDTALSLASDYPESAEQIEVVRMLLDYGSNPLSLNNGKETAVEKAVCNSNAGTLRLFLEKGCDPNYKDVEWGGTLLGLAESKKSREVIKLLLEYGADPNQQDGIYSNEDIKNTVKEITWTAIPYNSNNTPVPQSVLGRAA